MTLQIIPKSGTVLVRPIAVQPAKSASGLIQLADVYYAPETTGEVIALPEHTPCPECGTGRPSDFAVGEVIVFPPSAGDEIEWQGERYLLVPEASVLGVVVEA